jgi:bacillithiol system protein YtxJ
MNWIPLTELDQLNSIEKDSHDKNIVLFKHSTRCSISDMAKGRLDRAPNIEQADFYYLDLIAHRDISNEIATRFQVHHQSPQIILLRKGDCVYSESHNGITTQELEEQLQQFS